MYNLFNTIYPLREEFWKELQTLVQERSLPKKSLLLKEQSVCKEIHFLINGLARAYYFKDGEEITSWLMKESDLIISIRSFYKQIPGDENIELLEDSSLISLSFELLQYLYKKYPEFNFIGRVLTERYYMLSEERSYSLRMQTTQERYKILFETNPEIFRRVPLKYVASYLGMKPETLSRMRAKVI